MLNKFLNKKKYSNQLFIEELLKKDFNEEYLTESLKSENVNINYKDENSNTFLHICLLKNKFKSALWLIKHIPDTKSYNNNHQRAIDIIIDKDNHQLLRAILNLEDIDLNKKDNEGRTLLQDTTILGYSDMAKILIEFGADINSIDNNGRNVIFDALAFGDHNFIDYLISFDNIELNNIDINNNSVLHHKEIYDNDHLAVSFIQAGADPTIKNQNGQTFICDTALRGMDGYHVLDTALKHGADINSRVANENTILMELIASTTKLSAEEEERRKSLLEISKKVLLHGIDTNAIDINNETALFKAVRVQDIELISFLLSAGVDPNIQNNRKFTVLVYAVLQGLDSLDIVLLLLRYKADPLLKDTNFRTLYEVLNEIILHTHNKQKMNDRYILSLITKEGQYIRILKEILEQNNEDLNFLDSTGNPLFFNPLLNDHFPLFKLYIKHGLDIHTVNVDNHNIFFEYVLQVFKDNNLDVDFQNNISMLLSAKLDHNFQDHSGYTVVHKILETDCDINLFNTLTQVVLFDYFQTDKLGRSVMHTAVWHDKQVIMKRINNINPNIMNIADSYGILPLTYAALLGNQQLVLLFIEMNANIKSGINVPSQALLKFSPMLKNLNKLKDNIVDKDILAKIDMVIDQVKRDFKMI